MGRKNKEEADDSNKIQIGLMILENIPYFNKDFLAIEITDLSVTQLKINARQKEKIEKIDGKKIKKTIYTPEIIFNLKYNNEKLSLTECLLPSYRILAIKALFLEPISEKSIMNEKNIWTKMYFDLIVLPKKTLIKSNQTFDEHQNEIIQLKNHHKEELDNLRQILEEQKENEINIYRRNEEQLRAKIEEKNARILKLITNIPDEISDKILEFVANTTKFSSAKIKKE